MEQLYYLVFWFLCIELSIIIGSRYTSENKLIVGISLFTITLVSILYFELLIIENNMEKWFIEKAIYMILIIIPTAMIVINRKKEIVKESIKEPRYSKEFLEKNPNYRKLK